jgi:hypothetical protein
VTESPRDRLHRLIYEFRAGSLDTESFCARFENTYNLELDKGTLAPAEASTLAELFEQVIWYSPFGQERQQIPNYRSDEDITRAVELAVQHLAHVASARG